MQQQPVWGMHSPNPHFNPHFQSQPPQQHQQRPSSPVTLPPAPSQPSFEPQAQLPSHFFVQLPGRLHRAPARTADGDRQQQSHRRGPQWQQAFSSVAASAAAHPLESLVEWKWSAARQKTAPPCSSTTKTTHTFQSALAAHVQNSSETSCTGRSRSACHVGSAPSISKGS